MVRKADVPLWSVSEALLCKVTVFVFFAGVVQGFFLCFLCIFFALHRVWQALPACGMKGAEINHAGPKRAGMGKRV